jgi:hypothetical protein
MRSIPFVVLPSCLAMAALAVAGPREQVLARAARCASIADDAAWLACYRAAAEPMEASLAAARMPAPSAAEPPVATPAPALAPPSADAPATSAFGIAGGAQPNALLAPPGQLHPAPPSAATDHISAHVVRYSFSTQKYFTLVLDNGQVWQQINGDDDYAVLKGPAQDYQVTISHGFFGSYNLTFTGIAGLFRVRRIT